MTSSREWDMCDDDQVRNLYALHVEFAKSGDELSIQYRDDLAEEMKLRGLR